MSAILAMKCASRRRTAISCPRKGSSHLEAGWRGGGGDEAAGGGG